MDSEFVEQFRNLTSLSDVIYYYHVTNQDPETILNEGLFLVGDNIYTTAIVVPEEFREDPISYAEKERGTIGYRENASIVIIAIEENKENELVKPIEYQPSNWNSDEEPNFYISPKNILGYIDTENIEFHLNDEADIDYCYHM